MWVILRKATIWDNCDLIQGGFILLALTVVGGVIGMVPPMYRTEIHKRGV